MSFLILVDRVQMRFQHLAIEAIYRHLVLVCLCAARAVSYPLIVPDTGVECFDDAIFLVFVSSVQVCSKSLAIKAVY